MLSYEITRQRLIAILVSKLAKLAKFKLLIFGWKKNGENLTVLYFHQQILENALPAEVVMGIRRLIA